MDRFKRHGFFPVALLWTLLAAVYAANPVPIAAGPLKYAISGSAPAIGSTSRFTATTKVPGGSQIIDPAAAEWRSSNPAIAVWTAPGLLLGVAPGTVTVSSIYKSVQATQSITIAAPAGPTIMCPVSQSATSLNGQPVAVTYPTPTVSGGVSPISSSCSPPSGSAFPVGTTAVTCNATDNLNRTASCQLSVNVAVAASPTTIAYKITGSTPSIGNTSTFVATALLSDGSAAVLDPTWVQWGTANPAIARWIAPGVLQAVAAGTVAVTSTYRTWVASNTITIAGPTVAPPVISCPADQAALSTNGQPVQVSFPAPTVSGGLAPVSTVCTPPSGSSFGIGATPVTCQATDSANRVSSCQFSVNVVQQQPTLTGLTIGGASPTVGGDSAYWIVAKLSDGSTSTVDPSWVTWSTDNPAIAAWTAPGVLHGVSAGSTRVAAKWYGVVATNPVTVTAPQSGTVLIEWDPNPISENVTAYEVAYGTTPGVYSTKMNIGNATQYWINNLTVSTVYLAVRAFNGEWGSYSPETVVSRP